MLSQHSPAGTDACFQAHSDFDMDEGFDLQAPLTFPTVTGTHWANDPANALAVSLPSSETEHDNLGAGMRDAAHTIPERTVS